LSRFGELLDYSLAALLEFPLKKQGIKLQKTHPMDRRHTKLISTLMALLMFISPISSLAMQSAMQSAMAGDHSSHCQESGADSHAHSMIGENMESIQCLMEHCADVCASMQHCSSQAPIILSQTDHQGYLKGQRLALDPVKDSHLSVHPPGLYRPPRA